MRDLVAALSFTRPSTESFTSNKGVLFPGTLASSTGYITVDFCPRRQCCTWEFSQVPMAVPVQSLPRHAGILLSTTGDGSGDGLYILALEVTHMAISCTVNSHIE